jgi:t-SNARE complex subunit (syntaxin)
MATIETRLENVENQAKSLEMIISDISTLQGQMVELLKHQQDHLEKHDKQLEHQQQQLDSMQRFNVQTRRMWVSMAQKMDWDYEDPDLDS